MRYTFGRFRGEWRVWDPNGSKVSDHPTMEEARREVYRLNGWKYKQSKSNV